jgi:hypothetical protein
MRDRGRDVDTTPFSLGGKKPIGSGRGNVVRSRDVLPVLSADD